MREIRNTDDTIDSREIIERIDELAEVDAAEDEELDDEERAELASLRKFADEARHYDDWGDGVTLISEHYFTEYAKELAEDVGAIDSDAKWPATCIDWDAAAYELRMDYTGLDFDGTTFYVR